MIKEGDILRAISEDWKKFRHERVTVLEVDHSERTFVARWSDNPDRLYTYDFDDIGVQFKFDEADNINKILERYGAV